MRPEWNSFNSGVWEKEINVRDFIQKNYTPYDGDDSFLAGPTQNTKDLWAQVMDLSDQERKAGGVLDMDTKIISTITSHGPGYLNKEKETIVGFQTDKPFKRSLQPYGGTWLTTVPFSFVVILRFCFLKIREFSKNRIGCSEGKKSRYSYNNRTSIWKWRTGNRYEASTGFRYQVL